MNFLKSTTAGLAIRIATIVFILLLLADAARLLVVDRARVSDVIVVLAGETDKRPEAGLDLLRKGFGKQLILDVPASAKVFQWSELELAQRYVQVLPDASSITVCPIFGFSTKDEARDVSQCLEKTNPQRILIVTSDYHTRRALSTFERDAAGHDYSVAAVYDSQQFGAQWWRHREWAKTTLYECMRLAWWELVDRWR